MQRFLLGKSKPLKHYIGVDLQRECHFLRTNSLSPAIDKDNPLRIIVHLGGGLGVLFASICFLKAGLNVVIIEKTTKYRPLGGPIQLASNGAETVKSSVKISLDINNVARPFWNFRKWNT